MTLLERVLRARRAVLQPTESAEEIAMNRMNSMRKNGLVKAAMIAILGAAMLASVGCDRFLDTQAGDGIEAAAKRIGSPKWVGTPKWVGAPKSIGAPKLIFPR